VVDKKGNGGNLLLLLILIFLTSCEVTGRGSNSFYSLMTCHYKMNIVLRYIFVVVVARKHKSNEYLSFNF